MKIIPLSEGAFTVDKTKQFIPFSKGTDDLQQRATGSLLVEIQPFCIVTSEDVLVIGEGAEVSAEIDADTVIVRGGTVTGNIRARTAIELYVPARVVGNLWAPSIFIDKGVQVEGSCKMSPVEPWPQP